MNETICGLDGMDAIEVLKAEGLWLLKWVIGIVIFVVIANIIVIYFKSGLKPKATAALAV